MKKKELKNKIAELEKELDEAHNTERVLREIIALMKEQKCAYPQPEPIISKQVLFTAETKKNYLIPVHTGTNIQDGNYSHQWVETIQ